MVYRWIEERQPVDPRDAMAQDTALLEEMLIAGQPIAPAVHVYRWKDMAVSIGRLQPEDDVRARYPGLLITRRPTGGRAVLHGDGDLTITVATRDEWLPGPRGSVMSSYRTIVAGVVAAFARVGVPAVVGGPAGALGLPDAKSSIDCFARVSVCDVSDARDGRKLMGSAQRRINGAILQQMSVPGSVIGSIYADKEHACSYFSQEIWSTMREALAIQSWTVV